MIGAPAVSSHRDFDFLHGSWRVRHRKLRARLVGDTTWDEFDGRLTCVAALDGHGTVDDNWLDDPGGAYAAIAVRTFDPSTSTWSIWWFDGRQPHRLDPPVVGRFADGIGTFECGDVLGDRPIVVRFRWDDVATALPRWVQSFSDDGGRTWEPNWEMTFERA